MNRRGERARSIALALLVAAGVVLSGCFANVRDLPRVRMEGYDSNADGADDVIRLILYELHEDALQPEIVEIHRDGVELQDTGAMDSDDPWFIVYHDPTMKKPWGREVGWAIGENRFLDCKHASHRVSVTIHADLIANSTVECGGS
ncbi:MAG: hypothetical protein HY556_01370 [Euryarchaeota archaeon]|nr:hypothetical protein [Euryarchaeota archaeon]